MDKRLKSSYHRWCNLGIELPGGRVSSACTRFVSSLSLDGDGGSCRCGRPPKEHGLDGMRDDRFRTPDSDAGRRRRDTRR